MNKVKFLCYGILGGITYAFISFFLITPSLRLYPEGLVGWGVEGFLFALFFLSLRVLFLKYAGSMIFNTVIGMASGLFSCSFFVAFTYYNAVIRLERSNMIVLSELKRSIVSQLGYQSLGFMFLGAVVGIVISLVNNAHNHGADADAA